MHRIVATFVTVLLVGLGVPEHARGGDGSAEIISYGKDEVAGLEVEAAQFSPSVARAASSHENASRVSVPQRAAPGVAAPVAISAHNCIPRTDARGISLAYEFVESGIGDCVSFVSPPPAPDSRQPNARRPRRPSPEALAQSAFDRVISLAARPELRVAPGRIGLTGLRSYFWVGNDLRPVTATAGVRGLTVTAAAAPVRFHWDFGDGTDRDTSHGGRPWTEGRRGNVGHLYETKGRYEPDVTAVWAARWRVNRGPWRDLGYFTTEDSIDYRVREVVSILVRRR